MTPFDGDSLVKCDHCGREEIVDFATCLRSGWPKCCKGHTMRLVHTAADVGAATSRVLQEQSR